MARRKGYLDINRRKHGIIWWLVIGCWNDQLQVFYGYC